MKKSFFLILFLFFSLNIYSLNFSVAPTGFRVNLNKISTNEIQITNNTSEPLRLETFPEINPQFSEKYNLNSNIVIFPKIIAMKPGAKQMVRFRIKPSPNMEEGEYKSYLSFKEIPGEIKTVGGAVSNNTSSQISMQTEISISIFGEKGTADIKGSLSSVSLSYTGNNLNISSLSSSEGNTSIKFFYSLEVLNSNLKSDGFFGMSARNGKKEISLIMEAPEKLKGKKAKLVITDQDGKVYYDKVHTL